MAASDYDACENYVLASEGGYTNDPHDPGGPTNWGITIYDARMYWKHDASAQDVRAMPKAVAQDIYRKKYWDALSCDALPAGLDYTLFDYGVNSGIARSGKILRLEMGLSQGDWHVTTDVIAALAKRDIPALIHSINDERLHFLEGLRTWPHFGKGWGARVHSVDAISLHLNAAKPAPLPPEHVASIEMPTAKAVDQPQDLFAHLSNAADWPSIWSKVSAYIGGSQ